MLHSSEADPETQNVPAGRYEDVPLKIYSKSKYLCDNWSNLINCKQHKGNLYWYRWFLEKRFWTDYWIRKLGPLKKFCGEAGKTPSWNLPSFVCRIPRLCGPILRCWSPNPIDLHRKSVYSICLPLKLASQTRNITLQPSCPIIPVGRILQIEIRLL